MAEGVPADLVIGAELGVDMDMDMEAQAACEETGRGGDWSDGEIEKYVPEGS